MNPMDAWVFFGICVFAFINSFYILPYAEKKFAEQKEKKDEQDV